MAQVVGATQAAEKNNIELNEDQQASAPDPAMIAMFTNIVKEMFDYGRDILLKRRKDPKDDLLSVIANMEVDGEKLPDEYLDGSWLLIIIAGNETTRNSISGTIKLLTENPDQKEKLISSAKVISGVIEENPCLPPAPAI